MPTCPECKSGNKVVKVGEFPTAIYLRTHYQCSECGRSFIEMEYKEFYKEAN